MESESLKVQNRAFNDDGFLTVLGKPRKMDFLILQRSQGFKKNPTSYCP